MDPDHMQAIAARDQLWSSLRSLLSDIDRLAQGQFDGLEKERELIQLVARIVAAELAFRAEESPQS